MSTFPNEGELVVQRNDLEPTDPKDHRSLWAKFIDSLRQSIGFRPVYLAERWAVAKVRQEEVDADARLYAAKAQYELAMAQVHKIELEAEASYEKGMAEAYQIRTASNVSQRVVSELLDAKKRTPEEALEYLEDVMNRIRMAGGTVEIDLPDEQ